MIFLFPVSVCSVPNGLTKIQPPTETIVVDGKSITIRCLTNTQYPSTASEQTYLCSDGAWNSTVVSCISTFNKLTSVSKWNVILGVFQYF